MKSIKKFTSLLILTLLITSVFSIVVTARHMGDRHHADGYQSRADYEYDRGLYRSKYRYYDYNHKYHDRYHDRYKSRYSSYRNIRTYEYSPYYSGYANAYYNGRRINQGYNSRYRQTSYNPTRYSNYNYKYSTYGSRYSDRNTYRTTVSTNTLKQYGIGHKTTTTSRAYYSPSGSRTYYSYN